MSTLLSPEAHGIICFDSKVEKATSGLLHMDLQLPPTLIYMVRGEGWGVRGALYLCAYAQTLTRLFNKCVQWSDMPESIKHDHMHLHLLTKHKWGSTSKSAFPRLLLFRYAHLLLLQFSDDRAVLAVNYRTCSSRHPEGTNFGKVALCTVFPCR